MNPIFLMSTVIGAVLVLLGIALFSKTNFFNPQYDERQQSLNGRGTRLAYITSLLLATLYLMTARWIFPTVSSHFVAFSFFCIPAAIQVAHSILSGNLFALNIKRSTYHLVFCALTLTGLLMLYLSLHELFIVKATLPFFFSRYGAASSLLLGSVALLEGLSYAYRTYLDKKEE